MRQGPDLARDGVLAAGVFALAAWVHRGVLALALLGWDTYSTILASRIESVDDFTGTFTELMMDGQLPAGEFYRPVGNLSIAVDYAIWGLEPFGYQLTHLLLFAACAATTCLVARRLLGRGDALVGPVVGALFYALHPLVLSVLPVVARRTELLSALFILCALLLLPLSTDASHRRARGWGAGTLVALSFASKESGLVGLPILFVAFFTAQRALAPSDRARAALSATLPALVLCTFAFAIRMAVIGGLGGYYEPPAGTYLARLAGGLIGYSSLLGMTSPWDGSTATALLGTASILALAALALASPLAARWVGRARRDEPGARGGWDEATSRAWPLAVVGSTWIALQVAIAGNSIEFSPRYAFGMLAGTSLLLAAAVEAGWRAARRARGRSRQLGRVQLVVAALVMAGGLRGSPAWHDYPGLREASRIEEADLAGLETMLESDPPTRRRAFSVQRLVAIHDRAVDHAWMLAPWSAQAWADLRFPELGMRIEQDDTRPRSPKIWHLAVSPPAEHDD